MGDQLQQVVSRPDQGAVVAHPSTLAGIEHIRNGLALGCGPFRLHRPLPLNSHRHKLWDGGSCCFFSRWSVNNALS